MLMVQSSQRAVYGRNRTSPILQEDAHRRPPKNGFQQQKKTHYGYNRELVCTLLFICPVFALRDGHAQILPDAPVATQTSPTKTNLDDARQKIARRQFKEAETTLWAYLRSDKESSTARSLLAYTLFKLNEPKDSLAQYTLAAQGHTPSAEDLKYVALDYVLLNDFIDADKWISRSIAVNDRDSESWYALGRIRYTRLHLQDAVNCFEKALALDPKSVNAENNLGLAYQALNRNDDAIAAYRRALALEANDPTARKPSTEQPMLNLAIMLTLNGKLDEALALLTRAVAISPNDPKIRGQLGHIYLLQKKLSDAQREFEHAIALEPEESSYHFLLARVYRKEGMTEKAKMELQRVAALNGTHSNMDEDYNVQ
jgi:Flp pilus assembly protein TadD